MEWTVFVSVFVFVFGYYRVFIHSNLISCSLIGSLVNTRSVLKMSTALRVLRQDCAQTSRGAFGA